MSDDDPQTAMLLTETEWKDLAAIVRPYLNVVKWTAKPGVDPDVREISERRFNLINRIIEAAS